jgi:UDP-glucose:glycoprotein glucosyltransferase
MSTYFYDLPTTQKRRSKYILPSTRKVKVVSVPEAMAKSGLDSVVEGGSWVYPGKLSFCLNGAGFAYLCL